MVSQLPYSTVYAMRTRPTIPCGHTHTFVHPTLELLVVVEGRLFTQVRLDGRRGSRVGALPQPTQPTTGRSLLDFRYANQSEPGAIVGIDTQRTRLLRLSRLRLLRWSLLGGNPIFGRCRLLERRIPETKVVVVVNEALRRARRRRRQMCGSRRRSGKHGVVHKRDEARVRRPRRRLVVQLNKAGRGGRGHV